MTDTRPIKFRAWDEDGGMFIPSSLQWATTGDLWVWLEDESTFAINGSSCHLMQYTGLLDKNGKEVFEGDIVVGRWETGYGEADRIDKGVVKYNANHTCYMLEAGTDYVLDSYWMVEVIGNVHQHPELLEGSE